jgi:zinc protease
MLLVVVGDVERERLERLVGETVGRLPRGDYRWTVPPELPPDRRPQLAIQHRSLPTNYILGYFPGPSATSADYAAYRVATAILSSRVNEEVRTRRSLSYAAYAPFLARGVSAAGLYASTAAPNRVLPLFREQVASLQAFDGTYLLFSQWLEHYVYEYYAEDETSAAQADFLARAQLYRGDYRLAERFADELRHVTPSAVRAVARRYMHGARFAYVGDSTRVSRDSIARF